jgi:hypothetical protein
MDDARTEVLLAFRPQFFLQYVNFERLATGMDPGERLLLVDRIGRGRAKGGRRLIHALEQEFGLEASQILDMISGAFRLKAAVRGSAAEHHLGEHLRTVPGISAVNALDKDGMPDFEIIHRGQRLLIECKNVLARPTASGDPRVDFQKTRASKKDPCSRYYRRNQFDVLAACLHPITEKWQFKFALTKNLPPHRHCVDRLNSRIIVAGSDWQNDLGSLLAERNNA